MGGKITITENWRSNGGIKFAGNLSTTAITVETLKRIADLEAKMEQADALLGRILVLEERFEMMEGKASRMEEWWVAMKTKTEQDRRETRTGMDAMEEAMKKGNDERER